MNRPPLEAAVKWLVKERDRYKEKLETLIPYTKRLEADLRAIREEKDKECQKELQALEKRLKQANERAERLERENSALIKDYRQSGWFKQIEENQRKRKAERDRYRELLNRALYLLGKQTENGTE